MKLSTLLSDGAILQRNEEIAIYGYLENKQDAEKVEITVAFCDEVKMVKADKEGFFEAVFPPMSQGGPYQIQVSSKMDGKEYEPSIQVENVFLGDVWLLGGQSNMELTVARTLDLYADEVKNAKNPYIRMFHVPQEFQFHKPASVLNGGMWEEVTPDSVYRFSGVGYFFSQLEYEKNHVPIGLIHTAMGGSQIETYISEEQIKITGKLLRDRAFKLQEDMECTCDKNRSCKFCYEKYLADDKKDDMMKEIVLRDDKVQSEWIQSLADKDPGVVGQWEKSEWDKNQIDGKIEVPGMWKHHMLGTIRGSIWLQYRVQVPKEWINKRVQLRLGTIVDADHTYVNGVEVGCTEYRYPPRRYWVEEGILKPGENVITVRLVSDANVGGFKEDMPYCLKLGDKEIDLKGNWIYRIGGISTKLEQRTFFQRRPSGLYNGMIYPIHRQKLKGILFYQGEENSSHPEDYEFLLKALIVEWRNLFGQPNIPFVFAQLPDYQGEPHEIGTDKWDRLRRSQKKALALPNTAMAVLYDLGQYNELHPQNKKDVAGRLHDAYLKLI